MSEKMLVTQALDERDLLVKKIADKIAKASFVDTIKPNEDKVYAKRIGKEEYAKEAESAYQQIVDLIAHGVDGIHLYTMNNPYVAGKITEAIGSLL